MRYLIAIAVSCVVVFFLFLGMNKLITPDHRELTEREDVTMKIGRASCRERV